MCASLPEDGYVKVNTDGWQADDSHVVKHQFKGRLKGKTIQFINLASTLRIVRLKRQQQNKKNQPVAGDNCGGPPQINKYMRNYGKCGGTILA